jgi:uncharacterized protein
MNSPMKNNLEETIKIFDIPQDRETIYNLTNENCNWVNDLLNELNEEASDEGALTLETSMNIEICLRRRFSDNYKDHIAVNATIAGNYVTTCIRCLEATVLPIDTTISACFLPEALEKQEEFLETEEIYIFDTQMDLYFYKNRKIDIKELLHENLFLSLDPLPLHASDCKGLCGMCGTNLNTGICEHIL